MKYFTIFNLHSNRISQISKLLSLGIVPIMLSMLGLGCSSHHVLLDIPKLNDQIPDIRTGFYSVHEQIGETVSDTIGNQLLGKMVYLYKTEHYIDNKYFAGIKGSFLPNNYIKSKLIRGKPVYYWQNAEDEDINGTIVFKDIQSTKLSATITKLGVARYDVVFNYHSPHIWNDSVKTIAIAHRGISYQPPTNEDGIFPANTIPGFVFAMETGYEGVELDVRITKDNRFIVSHDEDLSVATTVKGNVADRNLADFENVMVVKSTAIPENRSTAKQAFIAAPMPALKTVLDRFLPDPRMKALTVDIKPDTEERIVQAIKYDFEGLSEAYQRKILFLTRSAETAAGIRKICPYSDIAIEGSIGPEPIDELEKYYPEAVGLPRQAHNSISFGANILLAFNSLETALEKTNRAMQLSRDHNYKICLWTFSKDWRFDFLRQNKIYPDFILSDVPYYQYALQEMRYNQENDLRIYQTAAAKTEYSNPVYKRLYKKHVRDFWFSSRNMFELSYGLGVPKEHNFEREFASVGMWEFKYGRSELDKYSKTNVELMERYAFIALINSAVHKNDPSPEQVTTKAYRFGIGSNDGTGYYGYDVSVVPYISQAFTWTRLLDFSSEDPTFKDSDDYQLLDRYRGSFRFGDRHVYGIKAEIRSALQINFGFETAVVYPRHLFWYWSGSFILSRVGYGLISHYTDKWVLDNHVIGPVVSFAVRAAYLYGYYLLRRQDMNWPFSTEAPLRYEFVNLGISFML